MNWEAGIDICAWQITVSAYCTARGLRSVLHGDLHGKGIQKRGDLCTRMADSFCCTVKANTHCKEAILQ